MAGWRLNLEYNFKDQRRAAAFRRSKSAQNRPNRYPQVGSQPVPDRERKRGSEANTCAATVTYHFRISLAGLQPRAAMSKIE